MTTNGPASLTNAMTEAHESHLARIKAAVMADLDAKYRAGQAEHGGYLWLKSGMLDQAIAEVLDLAVYLYTLREQQQRTYDDIQAGAVSVTCGKCARTYEMTAPQPLCRDCR